MLWLTNRSLAIKRFKDSKGATYQPPLSPYHPSFKQAQERITKICRDFFKAAQDCSEKFGYSDKAVENIVAELTMLHVPAKCFRKVGPIVCLGPAGVGKSSTINALLGTKSAALELDGTETGTYVVHEYKGEHPDQVHRYHVEVVFHSRSVIKSRVRKHCEIIERFRSTDSASADEGEDEDLEDKYRAAINFFTTMLCEDDRFSDLDHETSAFDDDEIDTEEFCEMIEEFRRKKGYSQDTKVIDQIPNESDLVGVFKEFSRPGKRVGGKHSPSPWVIVNKIIVRRDLDLLNSGLILADAPGLKDADPTVAWNTERCLADSGAILVFAKITRLTINTDLDDMLRKCISLGKERCTYLVVTYIDTKQQLNDIELDRLSEDQHQQLATIRNAKDELGRQVKDLKSKKNGCDRADSQVFMKLDRDLQAATTRLDYLKAQEKQLGVRFICADAEWRLRNKLRDLSRSPKAPDLQVHFVSNKEYQKHLQGWEDTDPPLLDVVSTGIPDLCRRLYHIQANSKYYTLSKICSKRIPNILQAVGGVLDKTPVERIDDLKIEVSYRVERMNHQVFAGMLQSITMHFKQYVIGSIETHGVQWTADVSKLVASWGRECRASTFVAFCRRSGNWKLPATNQRRSWNLEIRQITDLDLAAGFQRFEGSIEDHLQAFGSKLQDSCRDFKEAVDQCTASHGVIMEGLYNVVTEIQDELASEVLEFFEQLKQRTTIMRAKCVVGDTDTYIDDVMEPIYENLNAVMSGDHPKIQTGSKNIRRTPKKSAYQGYVQMMEKHLVGAIDGKTIFSKALSLADQELTAFLKRSVKHLENVVWANAKGWIMEDFDHRFSKLGEVTEHNPEAIDVLKRAADKALQEIAGPLTKLLEDCRIHEDGPDNITTS